GPGHKGLRRRHHANVGLGGEKALAELAAAVGTIKDRIMLGFQMRRTFDRHCAANVAIGLGDLFARKAQSGQDIEAGCLNILFRKPKRLQEVIAEHPAREDETEIEGRRELALDPVEYLRGESLCSESLDVNVRAAIQRAGAPAMADDLLNLPGRVAQPG